MRITGRIECALWGGLLFTAHPVHTEAVTFISSRTTLYAALFGLLAFLCLLQREKPIDVRGAAGSSRTALSPARGGMQHFILWTVLSLLCVCFGLLSKEECIVFPFIFLCWFTVRSGRGKSFFNRLVHGFIKSVPFLLLIAAYLALRRHVVGETGLAQELQGFDPLHLLQMAVVVNGMYARLLLFPYPLNADYGTFDSMNAYSLTSGYVLFVCIAAFLLYMLIKVPRSRFMISWYFLALLPFSNLIPIPQFFAERYLYLSSIPFAFATCCVLERLAGGTANVRVPCTAIRIDRHFTARILFLLLFVAYAGCTVSRNETWKDDLTLFRDASRKLPVNARARYNFGLALIDAGNIAAGMSEVQASVTLNPFVPKSRITLGELYARTGELDRAIREYIHVLEIDRDSFSAHNNLGIIYGRTGDYEEAIFHLERARQIDPGNFSAYNNSGIVYRRMGRFDRAEESFLQAHHLNPHDSGVLENLGNLMFDMDRYSEAADYFTMAVRHGSGESRILYKLGLIYGEKLNNPDAARRWWQKYLMSNPSGTHADEVRSGLSDGS
jgi:Flp pilus assembly protein TadD